MTAKRETKPEHATKCGDEVRSVKVSRGSLESLQYDPRRGRQLRSAAEALAAMEANSKKASKAAKRGWATRRRREREIGILADEAAARDSR